MKKFLSILGAILLRFTVVGLCELVYVCQYLAHNDPICWLLEIVILLFFCSALLWLLWLEHKIVFNLKNSFLLTLAMWAIDFGYAFLFLFLTLGVGGHVWRKDWDIVTLQAIIIILRLFSLRWKSLV